MLVWLAVSELPTFHLPPHPARGVLLHVSHIMPFLTNSHVIVKPCPSLCTIHNSTPFVPKGIPVALYGSPLTMASTWYSPVPGSPPTSSLLTWLLMLLHPPGPLGTPSLERGSVSEVKCYSQCVLHLLKCHCIREVFPNYLSKISF